MKAVLAVRGINILFQGKLTDEPLAAITWRCIYGEFRSFLRSPEENIIDEENQDYLIYCSGALAGGGDSDIHESDVL
jgi:hypothetical protein